MNGNVVERKKQSIFSLKNVTIVILLLHFSIFMIYPIIMAFVGSFHHWNPLSNVFEFTGIENYIQILNSKLFWTSMSNTLIFSLVVIFFRVSIGLVIALALYSKLSRFKTTFRTIFYMPTITPLVAVSFVWVWLYNPQFGLINEVFNLDINWLRDSRTALPAVMVMTTWKDFGYATIIYLGGLMSLPKDAFEAAEIDGANSWTAFKYLTWPLLTPITMLVAVTSLITYLQSFIQILVMTEGGPGTSTYTISYLIYEDAFINYNFGSASAMSVVLFVCISGLTLISFKLTQKKAGV
ncbi:ABC transporter permease [Halolactibacillus alkaliphilus]|uniref:ABC transporter permease n=1 Tax=Halolactibacillus alkaliphilus TaxID=442899 RepID=A0A511X3L8_9BACI|nr:sugar ABC transporter permease [Halolactibacillus alkaliphilus]GEN57549.1 ABC transporter permease [Halolactibacillus alkaliphilus]GGN73383.1 ABC transporter permease [Halolactibacillus alkaliphilus]SFO96060.1 multiple sugar transport system permease protein [Halolactibacillus alkaliphilus]